MLSLVVNFFFAINRTFAQKGSKNPIKHCFISLSNKNNILFVSNDLKVKIIISHRTKSKTASLPRNVDLNHSRYINYDVKLCCDVNSNSFFYGSLGCRPRFYRFEGYNYYNDISRGMVEIYI